MLTYCFNLIILITTGALATLNQLTSIEYIFKQRIESEIIYLALMSSIVLFYMINILFVIVMIMSFKSSNNEELNEMDYSEYELTFANKMLNDYGYWAIIFVFPLFLILCLSKFIGLFHLRSILENKNQLYFICVKSHTMYISYMMQFLFLTIPQLFLQCFNNLIIKEDVNDKHSRGIVNFSTVCGFSLIIIHGVLLWLASSRKFNEWNDKFAVQISKSFIEKNMGEVI
jgi:hypothetical protein